MANYKPQVNSFTIAGVTRKYSQKIIHLFDSTINATAADAMRDAYHFGTGNAYQSPANTKFIIIGASLLSKTAGAAGNCVFSNGITEDAETTTIMTLYHGAEPILYEYVLDDIICVANQFITINPSGTSTDFIHLWGYERPA